MGTLFVFFVVVVMPSIVLTMLVCVIGLIIHDNFVESIKLEVLNQLNDWEIIL